MRRKYKFAVPAYRRATHSPRSLSATETLENTILNFYYVVPAGHSLTIKVSYSNSMYTVTASYSGGSSGDQIQIFVYNYEPDVYTVNFNGTNYTSGEFVITLTSPGSP